MNRCIVCREKYDDQFISKYEILDKQDYIRVCEFCYDEHSEFDYEQNMAYIAFGNSEYY